MTTRQASCSCGNLRVATEGEPVRISICHCHACQKRTGSAFGVQARFPIDRAKPSGRASTFVRVGDEGGKLTQYFCPECGATVYYTMDQLPGFYGIPIGGFADNTFPAPKVAVYVARRHPWAVMPELELEEEYD